MGFYTLLTNIGKAKLANAQIMGQTVDLVEMALGDGNGSYYEPQESQTALINEVWRGNLNQITGDPNNPDWIIIDAVVPTNQGGFTIREVGIFDDEGDMIAVGKYPETYKPALSEGVGKDLYVRMILKISNVSTVTLKIDPTVVLASRAYVDSKINEHIQESSDNKLNEHIQEAFENDKVTAKKATHAETATHWNGLTNLVVSNWTPRSAELISWQSVCWSPELELFVAVSGSGTNRVMTSPHGINWTSRTAEASDWRSVCWSPKLGLFVAVGDSGTNRVMTSPDGINWTAQTAAAANDWRSVCWSPELGLFVAVASDGTNRVMTSPDGINWTPRSAESNRWRSVCWSPKLGLFVAVAYSGTNRVMTSPDGINWTPRSVEPNYWRSVCWSPELELFVAVACDGTNRVMTSPDGINWTPRTAESNNWQSVCWSPELGMFAAVADYGTNRVMTSLAYK